MGVLKGTIARRGKDEEVASDVDEDGGGASWNRTSDLSIISANLTNLPTSHNDDSPSSEGDSD
jgi:hypothetical protein